MFAYNEKLTLTAMNVYDRSCNLIYLTIPFPLKDENIAFPENTAQLSITEYHEGRVIYGHNDFNIYIGKVSTIEELIDRKVKLKMNDMLLEKVKAVKDTVVYYESFDNICEIFAEVEPGDIVVETIDELRKVLKQISEEFVTIRNSVNKIRKLSYKSNNK